MDNINEIKVYTTSNGAELNISAPSTKQVISATNNRAQYFAEQAKKYRDEAKLHRDNAKYYAEQNSDVTFEYIDSVRATLEDKISGKQDAGNYALKEELPLNVSELANDADYVDKTTLSDAIQEVTLPSQENCAGMVLMTDGLNEYWSGLNTYQLFDTKLSDHILSEEQQKGWALQGTYVYKEAVTGSRYGYPDFYNKCLAEKEGGVKTEITLGDSTITMYIHSNGHQFYDISDKSAVDAWFELYGYAWFYGVDTENERIFLPRNKYFAIKGIADTVPVIGNGMTLGLIGASGNAGLARGPYGSYNYLTNITSGYGKTIGTGGSDIPSADLGKTLGVTTDTTKSGLIAKTSSVVQPNEDKYLYICVGNTGSQSTVVDVVEVTTTENDTIPLGYSVYQANGQPSVSWLKSEGQWNDGNIYTTFYNEFVQKIGQGFAGGTVVEYTNDYTDYDLVINQNDMTFRLPLLDGSENQIGDRCDNLTLLSSNSSYTAPANGWYYWGGFSTSATNPFFAFRINSNETNGAYYAVQNNTSAKESTVPAIIQVNKGDIVYASYNNISTLCFRFIYAKGNGSLYFKVANAVQNLELLNAGEVLQAVSNVIPNNSNLMSSYGMPSSKYVDLTLGASGSTYTAPANGWFTMNKASDGAGQRISMVVNNIYQISSYAPSATRYPSVTIPVLKGDSVKVDWDTGGELVRFRFIYAQGAESEA